VENIMDIDPASRRDSSGFTTGVKTAVFVVVLGTVAALADHAYFVAPHAAVQPVVTDVAASRVAAPSLDGYALPPDMRPTQADVTNPAPTF
jgi:hypothetical protein